MHRTNVTKTLKAGHCFDTAHTACDRRFGRDQKDPDLAGPVTVRASAQLLAELGNIDHPDLPPVFIAKKSEGAFLLRVLDTFDAFLNGKVLNDPLVDDHFDPQQLFRGQLPSERKIKPQAVWCDEGTKLANGTPERYPERGV